MSEPDTVALGRVAVLLLLASLGRWIAHPGGEGVSLPEGSDVLPTLTAESVREAREAERRSRPLAPDERLDPNRAPEEELDRLPGVGPATARALVASREAEGPYPTPEALLRVRGVGPALLERIRPHLELAPPPGRPVTLPGRPARTRSAGPVPLDLNRADTLELQALPGVGPALARRIVEARREAPFRTVDELTRVRGIGPATLERLRPLVAVGR